MFFERHLYLLSEIVNKSVSNLSNLKKIKIFLWSNHVNAFQD